MKDRLLRRSFTLIPGAALLAAMILMAGPAAANTGNDRSHHNVFVKSATENASFTEITLPLYTGVSTVGGNPATVYYVITDASTRSAAAKLGVNCAPKLANAAGTSAVQQAQVVDGMINFPATVQFGLPFVLLPGPAPNYFPPSAASPASIGYSGYSPLIELPDGTVLNAPQVGNTVNGITLWARKVVGADPLGGTVVYRETFGFFENQVVHYASFDSSAKGPAAIEESTWAPALSAAPGFGDEGPDSAREVILAFTNGQTGIGNPQRQGLGSRIIDNLNPLNLVDALPQNGTDSPYSPLWDVHFATWAGAPGPRQTSNTAVRALQASGALTGTPDGTGLVPAGGSPGVIANCPLFNVDPLGTAQPL